MSLLYRKLVRYIYNILMHLQADFVCVLALHSTRLVALCFNSRVLKFNFDLHFISLSLIFARFRSHFSMIMLSVASLGLSFIDLRATF